MGLSGDHPRDGIGRPRRQQSACGVRSPAQKPARGLIGEAGLARPFRTAEQPGMVQAPPRHRIAKRLSLCG